MDARVRSKKRQLSHGGKAPDKTQGGLDWDKLRENYHDRLEKEKARGLHTEEHVEHDRYIADPKKYLLEIEGRKPVRSTAQADAARENLAKAREARKNPGGKGKKRAPRVTGNLELELKLYDEGVKPIDIAERVGINYYTVIKHLKDAGVWDPTKHRPRTNMAMRGSQTYTRKQFCKQGHDLDQPGAARDVYKKRTDADGNEYRIKSGRDCVECNRQRSNKYTPEKWSKDKRNPKNKICLCDHSLHVHTREGKACNTPQCECPGFQTEERKAS